MTLAGTTNDRPKGWIYVIVNIDMPGLLKVGFTTNTPDQRAIELAGTGVPRAFTVAYTQRVEHPKLIEAKVHKALDKYHHGKEWFRCDTEIAKRAILDVVGDKTDAELEAEHLRYIEAGRNKKAEVQRQLEGRYQKDYVSLEKTRFLEIVDGLRTQFQKPYDQKWSEAEKIWRSPEGKSLWAFLRQGQFFRPSQELEGMRSEVRLFNQILETAVEAFQPQFSFQDFVRSKESKSQLPRISTADVVQRLLSLNPSLTPSIKEFLQRYAKVQATGR